MSEENNAKNVVDSVASQSSNTQAERATEGDIVRLRIADIVISERRRDADADKVSALVNEIERTGLLHPITVRQCGEKYTLVAGLHRLRACEQAKRENVECKVLQCDELEAELIEIAENLVRNELHPIEIGNSAIRWIEILSNGNRVIMLRNCIAAVVVTVIHHEKENHKDHLCSCILYNIGDCYIHYSISAVACTFVF